MRRSFFSLRVLICVIAFAATAKAEPEKRLWMSKNGRDKIEGTFISFSDKDPKRIVISLPDGTKVTPKLADLCMDDQDYVTEITYVPRDITVNFIKDRSHYYFEQTGNALTPTMDDKLTICAKAESTGEETKTGWSLRSVDALGSTLKPRLSSDELTSEGVFFSVLFSVRNDSNSPISVPSPILIDAEGKRYYECDKSYMERFIPEGTTLPNSHRIQPGLSSLFCSIHELPKDIAPTKVEFFPPDSNTYQIQRSKAKGVQVLLGKKKSKGGEDTTEASAPPVPQDKKIGLSLFNVTKMKQEGDKDQKYYAMLKTRKLTYQVDLRLQNDDIEQVPLIVKVFFAGKLSDDSELIVDSQNKEVTLAKGRNISLTFTSKEIEEYHSNYFYYYSDGSSRKSVTGAQLNGIIVQVWTNSGLVRGTSRGENRLKKFENSNDVLKDLGVLEIRER